jgi:hypothetical protein
VLQHVRAPYWQRLELQLREQTVFGSNLEKHSDDQHVLVLVLVHELRFKSELFTVHLVLTSAMEVELYEPVLPPTELQGVARQRIPELPPQVRVRHLNGVAIVHSLQ